MRRTSYELPAAREFSGPEGGVVRLSKDFVVPLEKGAEYDLALEHPCFGCARYLGLWSAGKLARGPEEVFGLAQNGAQDFPGAKLDLGWRLYGAVATFESSGGGTLFSKCAPQMTNGRRTQRRCSFATGGSFMTSDGWAR
jgi:hypothetical protein